MDVFSQLLTLVSVRGVLDTRCHFGSPWEIRHEASAPGEVPFHILVSGEAELHEDGAAPVKLSMGDVVLFPRGDAHLIQAAGSAVRLSAMQAHYSGRLEVVENKGKGERADVLCGRFMLDAQSASLLTHSLGKRVLIRSAELSGAFPGFVGLMYQEAIEQAPGSEALLDMLCTTLFTLVYRVLAKSGPQAGLLIAAQNPRLQTALQAMVSQPQEPWSVDALAELGHMSRATFIRQFTQLTGESPGRLLAKLRMLMAARLLQQTRKPVNLVAEEVGYQSVAAFIRVFKDAYGVTPAQWRKQ